MTLILRKRCGKAWKNTATDTMRQLVSQKGVKFAATVLQHMHSCSHKAARWTFTDYLVTKKTQGKCWKVFASEIVEILGRSIS